MNSVSEISSFVIDIKELEMDKNQELLLDTCRNKIEKIGHQLLLSINETQVVETAFNRKENILICKYGGIILTAATVSSLIVNGLIQALVTGHYFLASVPLFMAASTVIYSDDLIEKFDNLYYSDDHKQSERRSDGIKSIRQKEKNANLECFENFVELFKNPVVKQNAIRLQDKEFVKHAGLLFTTGIKCQSVFEIEQKGIAEGYDEIEEIRKSRDRNLSEEIITFITKPDLIELVSYNQRFHTLVKKNLIGKIPSHVVEHVILEYVAEFDLSH